MPHRLHVFPDDGLRTLIAPLRSAKHTIDIRMFVFNHSDLIGEVASASRRGVRVRAMLNAARRNGERENERTMGALVAAGADVRDGSPDFALSHQKSMVVDNRIGFIESLNWTQQGVDGTRDYAVSTTRRCEIEEMTECFQADWARRPFTPARSSSLIWCPDNGRDRIGAFIDAAQHSLWIQNERYQDVDVIERLVRAANRGVKVHVMARSPHKLKRSKLVEGIGGLRIMKDVGAHVHRLERLKLHGKILLADGRRAIVGSINLTPGSFDDRRELAIETGSSHVVERLADIVKYDWKHSGKLDLSDEGVAAELHGHKT